MIEILIYAVDQDDFEDAELTGSRAEEQIIRAMVDPQEFKFFHEDTDKTAILYINGMNFKVAMSYDELKGLVQETFNNN